MKKRGQVSLSIKLRCLYRCMLSKKTSSKSASCSNVAKMVCLPLCRLRARSDETRCSTARIRQANRAMDCRCGPSTARLRQTSDCSPRCARDPWPCRTSDARSVAIGRRQVTAVPFCLSPKRQNVNTDAEKLTSPCGHMSTDPNPQSHFRNICLSFFQSVYVICKW